MKILHDLMIPDVEFHDHMIRVNLIMDHGMGNFGSYGYDPGS